MALSQCLEDSPLRFGPRPAGVRDQDLDLQEVYNERHRLALEELLAGGSEPFLGFLRRERIPNFLSDDEMQRIGNAAVHPRCASLAGEEALEQSVSGSMDCSSLTYFPEVSDVEPPLLELGWPGFTSGSYRGVTRAVAHFQPSYGEKIYGCKEAVRRLIRSSREVIAIVTDSLTDLDIFKDLQEASSIRRVPVYILLDQSCAPAFLKMCRNVGVRLDDLRQMRVRTITGTTYYMRSGARITGEVHERFLLIDGNRVATGSYRYDWTDGKLNSSNLVELSGQVTEKFDEEFRILYAQSLPLNSRGPPSVRHSSIYEHLLVKNPISSSPHLAGGRQVEPVCLTSTPSRKPLNTQPPCEPWTPDRPEANPVSDCSTMAAWTEEILASSTSAPPFPVEKERETPSTTSTHASTQTSRSVTDSEAQTDLRIQTDLQTELHLQPDLRPQTDLQLQPDLHLQPDRRLQTDLQLQPDLHLQPDRRPQTDLQLQPELITPAITSPSPATRGGPFKDSFHKLTEERQRHYSSIRSKLEDMVSALSQRRELADVTNVPHSRQRVQREQQPRLLGGNVGIGTWPGARCVHTAGMSEVEAEVS